MSAEKIIQLINKDAESEVKAIILNAKKLANSIVENAKKEAKKEAEEIILDGEKRSENIKTIFIARAKQEIKQEIMNVKESIITECFLKSYSQFPKIKEEEYRAIITNLMKESINKIGKDCKIFISREMDKIVANNLNLNVVGSIDASGGFIALSADEKVKLNNTFEAIITRRKDKIRVKIGKMLFS